MRKKTIAASSILVLCIAIQFIPVDRSNPPTGEKMQVPPAISEVLHNSCFDCHSNETTWPWYSTIAPVSWMLARHVHEGREHLNFSNWNEAPGDKKTEMKKEIGEEVSEGEMPPGSYLLLHPGAKLSEAEKEQLHIWSISLSE